jgi:hypothetical protein
VPRAWATLAYVLAEWTHPDVVVQVCYFPACPALFVADSVPQAPDLEPLAARGHIAEAVVALANWYICLVQVRARGFLRGGADPPLPPQPQWTRSLDLPLLA